jgi:hypothetical protein
MAHLKISNTVFYGARIPLKSIKINNAKMTNCFRVNTVCVAYTDTLSTNNFVYYLTLHSEMSDVTSVWHDNKSFLETVELALFSGIRNHKNTWCFSFAETSNFDCFVWFSDDYLCSVSTWLDQEIRRMLIDRLLRAVNDTFGF